MGMGKAILYGIFAIAAVYLLAQKGPPAGADYQLSKAPTLSESDKNLYAITEQLSRGKNCGLIVGMTRDQALKCWGKPERINTTTTTAGESEQFIYRGFQYVFLLNGLVTGIHQSR